MSLIIKKNDNNLEKKILPAEDRIEKIKNILDDIANNAANITNLNNKTDIANTNIANNTANITNMNNKIDTANTNIANNAADITNLNTKIDTANTNIANNTSAIDNLTLQLNANQTPIIDNISWNDNNHIAGNNYVLTINAHDPDNSNTISYAVTCNDSGVSITPTANENIFNISYPSYSTDTNVTYTITVTDNFGLAATSNVTKLVTNNSNKAPIIDSINWNTNDILTITAHDPDPNDTITYSVTCNGGVNPIQDPNNPNKFTMDHPTYNSSTIVTFEVTVTDNHGASSTETYNHIMSKTIIERGVFGGGCNNSTVYNTIDYITISTLGDAQDFGDLTIKPEGPAATSNGSNDRGIFGGGYSTTTLYNIICYITVTNLSNAIDFGDLTLSRGGIAAASNNVNNRGVFGGGGGSNSVYMYNIIDYVTISTLSNAVDFGDLFLNRYALASTSNGTNDRGVFGGGTDYYNSNNIIDYNIIDYITISTLGNAQDFGDLTIVREGVAATSNGINNRGVFGGGGYYTGANTNFDDFNTIDYITISTLGNAQDFGDLTISSFALAATSNGTSGRGVFGGGFHDSNYTDSTSGVYINTISYINIPSLSNASPFGHLTAKRRGVSGLSNSD